MMVSGGSTYRRGEGSDRAAEAVPQPNQLTLDFRAVEKQKTRAPRQNATGQEGTGAHLHDPTNNSRNG